MKFNLICKKCFITKKELPSNNYYTIQLYKNNSHSLLSQAFQIRTPFFKKDLNPFPYHYKQLFIKNTHSSNNHTKTITISTEIYEILKNKIFCDTTGKLIPEEYIKNNFNITPYFLNELGFKTKTPTKELNLHSVCTYKHEKYDLILTAIGTKINFIQINKVVTPFNCNQNIIDLVQLINSKIKENICIPKHLYTTNKFKNSLYLIEKNIILLQTTSKKEPIYESLENYLKAQLYKLNLSCTIDKELFKDKVYLKIFNETLTVIDNLKTANIDFNNFETETLYGNPIIAYEFQKIILEILEKEKETYIQKNTL